MLNISNISITFNSGTTDAKKALDDISLKVNDGDFITVIGANGAGKSTLFNAIAGTFIVDSGKIELNGRDITLMPEYKRARKIGRLFQDPMKGSAPGMTVEENLALAAGRGGWLSHVSKADKKAFRERVALLDMGLENRMSQPVGLPPELLLLDEHTAALDPGTAEKVLSLTEKIVAENKLTCMMITHNMQSALELGNRTIMMNNGQIIMDTSGEERKALTVADLLQKFKEAAGRDLDNDRMLLI